MPGELNSPYRRDPFTGGFYPKWNEADEVHVAALQESNGLVGFFLFEAPQLRQPSDFICAVLDDEYDETGTPLAENARLDAPDADEFRVDYDAESYLGTGFVEVNASRVGQFFRVGYWGLGTPPRWETHLRAALTVSENFAVAGDLEVGGDLVVNDGENVFSVVGSVISAHGNRVRDVADAVADTDGVNKTQAESIATAAAIAIGNAIHGVQVFTASGEWTRPDGVRYVTVLAGSGTKSAEAVIDLDATGAPAAPFDVTISADEVDGFGLFADSAGATVDALDFPALIYGKTTLSGGTWGNGSQGIMVVIW